MHTGKIHKMGCSITPLLSKNMFKIVELSENEVIYGSESKSPQYYLLN